MRGSWKQFRTLHTLLCPSVILCLRKKTSAASQNSSKRLAVGLPTSSTGASFPPVNIVRVAMPGSTDVVVEDMREEELDDSDKGKGFWGVTGGVPEGIVQHSSLQFAGNWMNGPGSGWFLVERWDARTTGKNKNFQNICVKNQFNFLHKPNKNEGSLIDPENRHRLLGDTLRNCPSQSHTPSHTPSITSSNTPSNTPNSVSALYIPPHHRQLHLCWTFVFPWLSMRNSVTDLDMYFIIPLFSLYHCSSMYIT